MTLRRPLVRVGGATRQLPPGDTLPKAALPALTAADVGAVAAGDSRLTDAREWTATTVAQAEAEAGTATTRRAWTAQRVRQAITAWWAGLTVDASKITTGTFAAARIPTLNQSTTGNAATATKLATARTINGVSFDGTASITLGIDWSNVANKPATYAPSAHSHAMSDVTGLAAALDAKVPAVAGKGLSTEDYTSTEKSKLSGIEALATKNAPDTQLRVRATHTGTQAISTVAGLQAALDSKLSGAQKQLCTAWVNFNGTGTVTIRDSYNVSSITDNGTGDYTMNFAAPMDNLNYSPVGGGTDDSAGVNADGAYPWTFGLGSVKIRTRTGSSAIDREIITVHVFGGKN